MVKHWEQMIMERQVTECVSTEELFVLWQVMQQMEAPENGEICYPEIDRRTFHIDGKLSEQGYDGTVYLLREPDMRAYIQQGSGMPAIVDARRMIREKGIRFEPALKLSLIHIYRQALRGARDAVSGSHTGGKPGAYQGRGEVRLHQGL